MSTRKLRFRLFLPYLVVARYFLSASLILPPLPFMLTAGIKL